MGMLTAHPGAVPDVVRSQASKSVTGSDQVAVAVIVRDPVRVAEGVMVTVGDVRSMVIVDESRATDGPVLPAMSETVDALKLSATVPAVVQLKLMVYSAPLPAMPEIEHEAVPEPETKEKSEAMSPDTVSLKSSSSDGVRLLVRLVDAVQMAVGATPSMVKAEAVIAVAGPLFVDASMTLPASNVGITVPSVVHV